jgi:hypothetical protein
MLEEMIDDPSNKQGKEKQEDCCDAFTDESVDIQSVISEKLVDKVTKAQENVHGCIPPGGNKKVIYLIFGPNDSSE